MGCGRSFSIAYRAGCLLYTSPERILKDVVVVLRDDQKTMLISAVGENLQKRVDFIVVEICLIDEAAVEPDGSAADADGVKHQVGAEMERQKRCV